MCIDYTRLILYYASLFLRYILIHFQLKYYFLIIDLAIVFLENLFTRFFTKIYVRTKVLEYTIYVFTISKLSKNN